MSAPARPCLVNTAVPRHPNLLPIAGLVSVLVLLLGSSALFALSYTNQKSTAALTRLGQLHAAQVAAVETRVSFKTQVQEWKNILLRGRDAADFQTYHGRFRQRGADVQAGLAAIQQQLASLALDHGVVAPLLAAHQALGAAYETALADFRPTAPDAPFAIDARIRGADRKLNDDIDALATTVERAAAAELKACGENAIARYATLRRVTLAIATAAVLAAFWLVYRATRAA